MRLLNVDTFRIEEFFVDIPPYAVLSHTWGKDSEEVSYQDVLNGRLASAETRPIKVTGCCKEAKSDGYQYVWIDTCCIDKTNSVELNEAINSMFRWYREAAICYAYLSDVPHNGTQGFEVDFSSSRWFQRGWTLQELLAPLNMRFYDADWECIGTKGDLCDSVEARTGIPIPFLLGITELQHATVAQRMSWAASRVTTRPEDMAYCLLGIFGVYMPLIYGEGNKAFRRLQEQLLKDIGDYSIFAWDFDPEGILSGSALNIDLGTALAPNPSCFLNSGRITVMDQDDFLSTEIHGGSVRLPLSLHTTPAGQILGLLKCGVEGDQERLVGIPLCAARGGQSNTYHRLQGCSTVLVMSSEASTSVVQLQLDGVRKATPRASCWFHIRKSVPNLKLIGVHPGVCWHKERALIEAPAETDAEGAKQILVRFRQSNELSADFVAVFESGSEAQPRCGLMIASRNTPLEEIASKSEAWNDAVIGKENAASNGHMNLAIELETVSASSSQRRFSLKPVILEGKPRITIIATAALQTLGATEMRRDLDRISNHRLAEVQALRNDMTNVGQTVAQANARLDKVRAEIEALKLEELRAAEEYDRAREQEVELRDSWKRVKKGYSSIRKRIETMDQFLGIYNSGAEGPEKEVALSEVAAQVLPFAILDKYDSFARLLIDQASNVTTEDHEGFTPLDHAVLRGQEELVQLLIDKGASVSAPGREGVTPLHNATDRGFFNIVCLLLERGAHPSPPDARGVTPLHLAAVRGLIEIAILLVGNGASVTARDRDGMTPLDVAVSQGQDKLYGLLSAPETSRHRNNPIMRSRPKPRSRPLGLAEAQNLESV